MNMLNWLSSDEDLISIRPEGARGPAAEHDRSQMQLVFYTSLIFLPLMAVVAGVSVWWKRR